MTFGTLATAPAIPLADTAPVQAAEAAEAAEPLEPTSPPSLRSVLARLGGSLLVAVAVPGAVFYAALVTWDVTVAVVLALVWTYAAIVWRWATRRPMSGLLAITVSVMTAKTIFTLATGNTFVYFFQPVVTDGLVAALFLVSLATARPVVSRLASDFYPMSQDLAARPRIRRLFRHLTLVWAIIMLAKGGVTLWLLLSQSLVSFVLLKNVAMLSLTAVGVAVTVAAAVLVARKEGLLAGSVAA